MGRFGYGPWFLTSETSSNNIEGTTQEVTGTLEDAERPIEKIAPTRDKLISEDDRSVAHGHYIFKCAGSHLGDFHSLNQFLVSVGVEFVDLGERV